MSLDKLGSRDDMLLMDKQKVNFNIYPVGRVASHCINSILFMYILTWEITGGFELIQRSFEYC